MDVIINWQFFSCVAHIPILFLIIEHAATYELRWILRLKFWQTSNNALDCCCGVVIQHLFNIRWCLQFLCWVLMFCELPVLLWHYLRVLLMQTNIHKCIFDIMCHCLLVCQECSAPLECRATAHHVNFSYFCHLHCLVMLQCGLIGDLQLITVWGLWSVFSVACSHLLSWLWCSNLHWLN